MPRWARGETSEENEAKVVRVAFVTTVQQDDLVPKLLVLALAVLFELLVPQSLSHTAREVLLALLGVAAVALWRWLQDLGVERIAFAGPLHSFWRSPPRR
jgi:hypothetical protein